MPEPLSIYVHIPFCQRRCSYCDFNTYAGMDRWILPYLDALGEEIRLVAGGRRRVVHTLFLGGGTPSLLSAGQLGELLELLREHFEFREDAEISLEANPASTMQAWLEDIRQIGFNRISLGVQSAQPNELMVLGRSHTWHQAELALAAARASGFTNINLDLIFGIPGQTAVTWADTLQKVMALQPDHLSLYALSVEEGTPLQKEIQQGLIAAPDDDLEADFYEYAASQLARAGYEQYEISNWAKPGKACRHNLQYWRSLPWLGLGAGAHGFAQQTRTANVRGIVEYIRLISNENPDRAYPAGPAAETVHPMSRQERMDEKMMMGLRLVREGVSYADFQSQFGEDLRVIYREPIERLSGQGLLESDGQRIRLTPRAYLLGNIVFREFV